MLEVAPQGLNLDPKQGSQGKGKGSGWLLDERISDCGVWDEDKGWRAPSAEGSVLPLLPFRVKMFRNSMKQTKN